MDTNNQHSHPYSSDSVMDNHNATLDRVEHWAEALAPWLLLCLFVSVVMHLVPAAAMLKLGIRYGGLTGQDGDNAPLHSTGAGGSTIEITIAGAQTPSVPVVHQAQVPVEDPKPPAPAPQQDNATENQPQPQAAEVVTVRRPTQTPTAAVHRNNQRHPRTDTSRPQRQQTTQNTTPNPQVASNNTQTTNPNATSPGTNVQGTGHTVTSGAMAPGSVGWQRAGLPGAVACNDPVAGVWRARKYYARQHDWVVFTLRINRSGDRLSGSIIARTWAGGPSESRPTCAPFEGYDHTIRMPAFGNISGMHIDFGATTYQQVAERCPNPPQMHYNPDHFSGTIDPAIQEFQSVNNDGGRDINEPYVFRRIACNPGDELRAAPGAQPAQ